MAFIYKVKKVHKKAEGCLLIIFTTYPKSAEKPLFLGLFVKHKNVLFMTFLQKKSVAGAPFGVLIYLSFSTQPFLKGFF